MTRMLPTAVTAVAMATLAAAAGPVHAADAGDWIVRGGLTYISPEEGTSNRHGELGPALAGTDVNVGSQAGFGGTLTYMVDDNIGFELLVGTPFKHDLALAGGALAGAERNLRIRYRHGVQSLRRRGPKLYVLLRRRGR